MTLAAYNYLGYFAWTCVLIVVVVIVIGVLNLLHEMAIDEAERKHPLVAMGLWVLCVLVIAVSLTSAVWLANHYGQSRSSCSAWATVKLQNGHELATRTCR